MTKKVTGKVIDPVVETKSIIETKTDETIQEMNKITDKAIEEIEAEKVETEEKVLETSDEKIESDEKEFTKEELEEEAAEKLRLEEAEAEKLKLQESQNEEETEESTLSQIKKIIKSENYFNYVSFGKHLSEKLTTKEIEKFSDEFINSGILSTPNHYKLLSLLKIMFPKQ